MNASFAGSVRRIRRPGLAGMLGVCLLVVAACDQPLPTESMQARLELAAGKVTVEQAGASARGVSGVALLPDAVVRTGAGARALVRLGNGSAMFLRGDTAVRLGSPVKVESGEVWLDAPPTEREAVAQQLGEVTVFAVDAGLSLARTPDGARVYLARGEATVTAPGGRVEVRAGEQATVAGAAAPEVSPVEFWEDWTGGMADSAAVSLLAGAGAGQIYGVDPADPDGQPARVLEISRQSVRAVIRDGLAETEVDQTFFNSGDRALEGWYWFAVPEGANVTGFAVETDGVLVEGEFIERREAAARYAQAAASGHEPALLEWIDSRTFRARIFPVTAGGARRVVLRYLQLLPQSGGVLRYLYPLQSPQPVRIGEFSLSVDLGEAGAEMGLTTLADARVEDGGRRVTMRRSGYTPRADFLLEARLPEAPEPMRFARLHLGSDTADYVLVRFTPDFEWDKGGDLPGEVVLVVDTSAGTDEVSRAAKTAAAESILRALSAEDRFALVSLDVQASVLYPPEGLAPAGEAEIRAALEHLADHSSGGATDMAAMFDVALARLHAAAQPAVIYVGDGVATSGEMNGEQLIERLRRSLSTSRARLFTVGVGPQARGGLLASLAAAGGGGFFQVDEAEGVTDRALRLVSALKTPTMTDFELDLGAGLDEVFVSANGKVTSGEEVLVLARTHHDLPGRVKVKGRLAGQAVERDYSLSRDDGILNAFVARLWAAEYLRRLLGAAGDPQEQRGRIMQLGIEYGLMTPYTSILALESEAAYQQQGIRRVRSPLRGVKLSGLTPAQERRVALALVEATVAATGLGCNVSKESAPEAVMAQEVSQPAMEEKSTGMVRHKSMKDFGAPPAPGAVAGGAPADRPMVAAAGDEVGGQLRGLASRNEETLSKEMARPSKAAPAPLDDDRRRGPSSSRMSGLMQVCSDSARRPLRERAILWRQRVRTAAGPQELVARYLAARQACELPDWRSEATFLRVLQPAVRDEGTAAYLLQFFADQPEVQRYLARLILRRADDPRVVAVVERVLFGEQINWASVDAELASVKDPALRLERLQQVLARAPDDPNGIIRLVHALSHAGQLDEALVVGRRLRDAGLATPFLSRELGDLLAENALVPEALRTYSEIVEFDPDSLPSRRLLGDIYLAHGWHDAAYRQYRVLTERAPAEALFQLRLAAAAAGAGRTDEALRLERGVIRTPGRPGPDDPRRWAALCSAARLGGMLAGGQGASAPDAKRADAIKNKLKELQLFRGASRLVLLSWTDLGADVALGSLRGGQAVAVGEATDAAASGLAALMLSPADLESVKLRAFLRSPRRNRPLKLQRLELAWDGKDFSASQRELELPADATAIDL